MGTHGKPDRCNDTTHGWGGMERKGQSSVSPHLGGHKAHQREGKALQDRDIEETHPFFEVPSWSSGAPVSGLGPGDLQAGGSVGASQGEG